MADKTQNIIYGANQTNLLESYDLGDMIGEGGFSKVYEGISLTTGESVAIKRIEKDDTILDQIPMIKREVAALKLAQIDTPNIVPLIDVYEDLENIFIIFALIENSVELFDLLCDRGSFAEDEAAKIIYNIVLALEGLHRNGVIHRDIKTENIMSNVEDPSILCLIDFGLATLAGTDEVQLTEMCGSPGYVAPEILLGGPYGKACDMWSLGVTAYILLAGFPPWDDQLDQSVIDQTINGAYDFPDPEWTHISDDAKDFIVSLLVVNPDQRLTAAEAKSHPFLAKLNEYTSIRPNAASRASEKASGEIQILKDELNGMKENEKKLKALASTHEEEIKTLRTQLSEKHNTAKQLTVGLNEIESLKKEFDELKAKFENNEQIGIELKKENVQLKEQVNQSKMDTIVQNENEILKNKIQLLEEKEREATKKLNESSTNYNLLVTRAKEEKDEVENRLEENKKLLLQYQQDIVQVALQKEIIKQQEERLGELELENYNSEEEARNAAIHFQNLQLELERKVKELSEKENAILSLQTQTQKVEAILSKKDKELEDLAQSHSEEILKAQYQQQQNLEKKLRENAALASANKEYEKKIEVIEENERKFNQQKQLFETEKSELKELNENLLLKIKEHEKNHQNSLAEIQELRRDQMKNLEGTEKQHQQLMQLQLQQTQSFENEIERQKKELQSSKMDNEALLAQIKEKEIQFQKDLEAQAEREKEKYLLLENKLAENLKTYESNKKADEKKLTQQLNEEFQRKKKNYEQDLENQQNEFIQLKVQSETDKKSLNDQLEQLKVLYETTLLEKSQLQEAKILQAQLNKEQELQIQKQQQEHFDQQLKTVRESITNIFQNDLDSEKKKRINLQTELEEKEKNMEAQEKKFQELISEHKQDLARNDEMNKIELKKSELSLLSKHEAEVSDLKSQNEKTIVDLKQEFILKESVHNESLNALKIQNFEFTNTITQKTKENEVLEEQFKKKSSELQQQESTNEVLKKEIQDLKLKLAELQNARVSVAIEEENEQIFVTMPRASRFNRKPQSNRLQGMDKMMLEQELMDAKRISGVIVGGKHGDEASEPIPLQIKTSKFQRPLSTSNFNSVENRQAILNAKIGSNSRVSLEPIFPIKSGIDINLNNPLIKGDDIPVVQQRTVSRRDESPSSSRIDTSRREANQEKNMDHKAFVTSPRFVMREEVSAADIVSPRNSKKEASVKRDLVKEQPTETARNSKVATRPSRASEDLKTTQEQCEKLKTENEQLKVKVEKLAFHLRDFIDKNKQEEENKNSTADDERKAQQLLLLRDRMTSMKEEIVSKEEENIKLKKIVEALKSKLTSTTASTQTSPRSPTSLSNSTPDLTQTLSRHGRHDSPTISSAPTSNPNVPTTNSLKNSASDLIRSIENRSKNTSSAPSNASNNNTSTTATTATPTIATRSSSSKVSQPRTSQPNSRTSSPHKVSPEAKRTSIKTRESVHSSRHISAEALPDQLAAKPQFPSKGMANKLQNKLEKTIQYAPPDAMLNLEFRSSGIGKVGTELAVPFEIVYNDVQPRKGAYIQIEDLFVVVNGPHKVTPIVTGNGSVFVVNFIPMVKGIYELRITVRKATLYVAKCKIIAETSTKSYFESDKKKFPIGQQSIKLVAVDSGGSKQIVGGDTNFSFKVVPIKEPGSFVEFVPTDNNNGTYSISFKVTKTHGEYDLYGYWNGENILNSPFKVYS